MVRGLASWFLKCPVSLPHSLPLSLTAVYELFRLHLHKELHLWYLISQLETLCNRECQLGMRGGFSGYVHKKSGKTNLSRRRGRSRKHGEKSQRIPKLRGLGRFVLLQWIVPRSNGLSKDLDLLSISSSIYEVTSAYSVHSFKTEDSTRLQVQALIISLAAPSSYLLQNTASAGHSEWWCFCLIFILAQITLVHFLWHFFHWRSLDAHARIKKNPSRALRNNHSHPFSSPFSGYLSTWLPPCLPARSLKVQWPSLSSLLEQSHPSFTEYSCFQEPPYPSWICFPPSK